MEQIRYDRHPNGYFTHKYIWFKKLVPITQSSEEDLKIIKKEIQNTLEKINMVLKEENQKINNQLEDALNKANQNKLIQKTTIRKALSKSAIVKKIQALKNPTPEQLDKILAAIEG
jgi:hypothetical protein